MIAFTAAAPPIPAATSVCASYGRSQPLGSPSAARTRAAASTSRIATVCSRRERRPLAARSRLTCIVVSGEMCATVPSASIDVGSARPVCASMQPACGMIRRGPSGAPPSSPYSGRWNEPSAAVRVIGSAPAPPGARLPSASTKPSQPESGCANDAVPTQSGHGGGGGNGSTRKPGEYGGDGGGDGGGGGVGGAGGGGGR